MLHFHTTLYALKFWKYEHFEDQCQVNQVAKYFKLLSNFWSTTYFFYKEACYLKCKETKFWKPVKDW